MPSVRSSSPWRLFPLAVAACMSGDYEGGGGGCAGETRGALGVGWFRTSDCPSTGQIELDDCLDTAAFATDARARITFTSGARAAVLGARSTGPAVRVDATRLDGDELTIEVSTAGPGVASLVVDGPAGEIDHVELRVEAPTAGDVGAPTRLIAGARAELYGTVTVDGEGLIGRGGYTLVAPPELAVTPAPFDRGSWFLFGDPPDYELEARAVGIHELAVEPAGLAPPRSIEVIGVERVREVRLRPSESIAASGSDERVVLVTATAIDDTAREIGSVPCAWRSSRPAWLVAQPWGVMVRSASFEPLTVTCEVGAVSTTIAVALAPPA